MHGDTVLVITYVITDDFIMKRRADGLLVAVSVQMVMVEIVVI